MANECMPKYEPGDDLTGHVSQAGGVLGKRCARIIADKQGVETVSDGTTGGNIVVGYPLAGGRTVGVFGYDAPDGRKVKLVRGPGKVVPILAGAGITFDQLVMATVTGTVIPWTFGNTVVGRAIRSAANGTDALIELAGVQPAETAA